MPPGHEFSCQRHFLSPSRSANRWNDAAGSAGRQAPCPPARRFSRKAVRAGEGRRFGSGANERPAVRPSKQVANKAGGRSLRGSGSVFGKRQDVMCRRAAAEGGAPGIARRIEGRPLRRADNDPRLLRFAAQQAHRMPPDTIATGMPVRLLPGQCASRCRRADSACPRIPACGSRAFPGVQDNYRNGAAPCRTHQGGSVRESSGITIACARIRAAQTRRSGSVIALDNCRYRA